MLVAEQEIAEFDLLLDTGNVGKPLASTTWVGTIQVLHYRLPADMLCARQLKRKQVCLVNAARPDPASLGKFCRECGGNAGAAGAWRQGGRHERGEGHHINATNKGLRCLNLYLRPSGGAT